MKVKDIAPILCRDHGLVSVESDSLDEFLALGCSTDYIVEHFGDKPIVDMYPDFNPLYGANIVIRIA